MPNSSKLFKRFQENVDLAYIYQLTKFGGLMSCGSKDVFKNAPSHASHDVMHIMMSWSHAHASWTHAHHGITDLVNQEIVGNTKTWISREWRITFLWNKKILNLHLRWHILRSYCFVVEVTFNIMKTKSKQDWKIYSTKN